MLNEVVSSVVLLESLGKLKSLGSKESRQAQFPENRGGSYVNSCSTNTKWFPTVSSDGLKQHFNLPREYSSSRQLFYGEKHSGKFGSSIFKLKNLI